MSRGAAAKQLLLWCLPALALGFVLRALLAAAMPFAYMQHDSYRLLLSGAEWLTPGTAEMYGENVPFLVPALFRLARFGPLPALVTIELAQHALGLLQIVLAGALVRGWMPERWKWWIVPATLVFAVHPSLLWFEHTVMLEAVYVFAIVALAAAGTWVVRQPSLISASALCAGVLLVAFTRPEGKLFAVFGAAVLTAAFWKKWRGLAMAAAMFIATLGFLALGTVAGESGLLLYSSVLHLSPEQSRKFPEAAPYVATLRRDAVEAAKRGPAFVSRPQRIALEAALLKFVSEHPDAGSGATNAMRLNSVAKSLGYEACLRAPGALLALALDKFRVTAGQLAHGEFSRSWLHERQIEKLRSGWRFLAPIDVPLYGRDFPDADALAAFVEKNFRAERVRWFGWLHDQWRDLYDRHLRDTRYAGGKLPGLPLFYVLPLAGALIAMVRASAARRFHLCWVLVLGALWFVVMLTANERSRFRMGFEPMIFLYPFIAFDAIAAPVRAWLERKRAR